MKNDQEPYYDEKSTLHQTHVAFIVVGIVLMFLSSLGFFYGMRDGNKILINTGIVIFFIGLALIIFIVACIYIDKKKKLKK